jgi:prepilin-type N-terminal cleavage/methylation domain-containing protein
MIHSHYRAGFTLIEMIVSLAIFSVVVTIAVGALLVLISGNQRLQGEQGVMTNIAFAMDSMTREMRTGFNYYCDSSPNNSGINVFNPTSDIDRIHVSLVNDCPEGRPSGVPGTYHGVSFFEGGDSITSGVGRNRILYYYDSSVGVKTIFRRVADGEPQQIIASNLIVENANFFVTGSAPLSSGANTVQPSITIFLQVKEAGEDKTYEIETTVTQRILDL